ncbi:MAG: hypothetical protein PCFJNLEI_00201 [Verrucomicrobiae bacterium]|nr:hypothetical protein [Verrucomicrobiae bacterium]
MLRDNWKLLVTILVTLIVLALAGLRFKRAFAPQAPAALNYVQHTSPGFTFNADLRRAWKSVAAFVAQAQREEKAALKKLTQLSFVHVSRLPNEALIWDSLEARNPGFETLRRVERSEPGAPAKLIGYYTLDGQPLTYDTKTDLRNPRQTLTTVTLAAPLGPGKAELIFRVLSTTARITTNTPGKGVVSLGRLPANPAELHALGLAVPQPASLAKYPTIGARVQNQEALTTIIWFNTEPDSAPRQIQVTFDLNRSLHP